MYFNRPSLTEDGASKFGRLGLYRHYPYHCIRVPKLPVSRSDPIRHSRRPCIKPHRRSRGEEVTRFSLSFFPCTLSSTTYLEANLRWQLYILRIHTTRTVRASITKAKRFSRLTNQSRKYNHKHKDRAQSQASCLRNRRNMSTVPERIAMDRSVLAPFRDLSVRYGSQYDASSSIELAVRWAATSSNVQKSASTSRSHCLKISANTTLNNIRAFTSNAKWTCHHPTTKKLS